MTYKNSLDGVRALCIIFTMFNHTKEMPTFFSGFNFGVDIFFSLSGFLITTLIINELEETGKFDLKGFYIRRFFRIVPLYYVTVFLYATIVVSGLVNKNHEQIYSCFAYLLTFNREYYFNANGVFGHAWTLGIEEKFYVCLPLVVFLTIKFKKRILSYLFLALLIFVLLALSGFEIGGFKRILWYYNGYQSCISCKEIFDT